MTDKLFISLSIEQQEAVSGGDITDIADNIISGITTTTGLFPGLSSSDIAKFILDSGNTAIFNPGVPTITTVT